MKKADGQCGLLWSIWHLARSPACIMYLVLLLCKSHVNLCAVNIQTLEVEESNNSFNCDQLTHALQHF